MQKAGFEEVQFRPTIRHHPLEQFGTSVYRYQFVPLVHRAGVPHIRFHDLQHTSATLMLLAGVPVKVVSEMLGHSSISITLDLYAHVLPEM